MKTDPPEQRELPPDSEAHEPGGIRRHPLEGFRYALEGIIAVVRTQRHMRFHFFSVVLVLLMGFLFRLDKREMLVLLFTISLVLIAEMFNSAVEATVDLVTEEYHPKAKFAKDIAAGAVLVATLNAVVVAWVLFMGDLRLEQIRLRMERAEPTLAVALTMGTVIIFVVVSLVKVLSTQGKVRLFHGGAMSGHAALGFFFAMAIIIVSGNLLASILALLLAALVAQSRVEAKVHSLREVVLGSLLGIAVAGLIYWLVPR
ncbi:MAG: diacylglycerol kinase [Fimbriimonadales bacterium]|jgi:diacylglycerol kinase (ATP)|nr:diacylglycerol kinase [Armatimonadota bacterium]MCX7686913.1 diacylglycerol kinase [Fimbriimonadales bacterium]CUU11485.1 diacylglycerol kinase (ATP) [Armatimonadetes bacterium GBS]CUU34416.1 diacylglycerol kinase (ATP) [Armatimonadetes bacterium DC]CUU35310.1 diacylglycerol kinase (ATP) [Armatimonadetes bacterium GXS]GBC90228.1 Undecaprenol kinase [bacterium HR14]